MGKAAQEPHRGGPLASVHSCQRGPPFRELTAQWEERPGAERHLSSSGTFSSQHPGENTAQSKSPSEKNHQGGGVLALETRLSVNTAQPFPAARTDGRLVAEHQRKRWACLRLGSCCMKNMHRGYKH